MRPLSPTLATMSLVAAAFATLLMSNLALAAKPLQELVAAAQAASGRPEADRARDANRKPFETLEFFRLEPDMRVLELVPGGGWYTRILAPVLEDEGKLYVAIGTDRIAEGLLKEPGFEKVEVVKVDSDSARKGRRNDASYMNFDVENVDLVLTFRNLHNFEEGGRKAINKAAFEALKPGGYYGVKDHTRRHMEPDTQENGRRMDPVRMIHEIESAGFDFVAFSDLHRSEADNLDLEVGHESVTGQTDRFTLLFQKPEK